MTLADFKRKMQPGINVAVKLFYYDKVTNEPYLSRDYGYRELVKVQSNSYAFKTMQEGKEVKSWCDWPKAKDIEPQPDGTLKITFQFGYFIYQFQPGQ